MEVWEWASPDSLGQWPYFSGIWGLLLFLLGQGAGAKAFLVLASMGSKDQG